MEGWRRAFVVLCWIAGGGVALIAWSTYPDRALDDDVWTCNLRNSSVAPERARQLLALGHIPQPDNYDYPPRDIPIDGECADDLEVVAMGTARPKRIAAWRADALEAAWYTAIVLAVIFAFGRSLGWVWRGFRPLPTKPSDRITESEQREK